VSCHKPLLIRLYMAGVERCKAASLLPDALPKDEPRGRTIVLGAGKAAGEMALTASGNLRGSVTGCVATRYGHLPKGRPESIEILEAGHPLPDHGSVAAGERILDLARSTTQHDRIVFLFSGGGSALLCLPASGVSLQEKISITDHLIRSGAPISDINEVRSRLSRIKGGRLAAASGTTDLHTFLISDVVGDDPAAVATGPTVPRESSPRRALQILDSAKVPVTEHVRRAILANANASCPPHPIHMLASNGDALAAVASMAESEGWRPMILPALEGIASEVGRDHASVVASCSSRRERVAIISGGELTVQVQNSAGRGGPNQEYAAALCVALEGMNHVEAIACDSDGIDGSCDAAGAYICSSSLQRARQAGLDFKAAIAHNDTYRLFDALGDLIITGPTRTNVNDIRIILFDGSA
jgi:glycerate 2-kinase